MATRLTLQSGREFDNSSDGYTAFHSACVHAVLGDPQGAMERLALAQARGYFIKSELVRNTDLDILHGLPGFQELVS